MAEEKPLLGWLITGLLVLVGATVGGLVAASLVPRSEPAVARQDTPESPRPMAKPGMAHPATAPAPSQHPAGPAAAAPQPTPPPVPSPAPPPAQPGPKAQPPVDLGPPLAPPPTPVPPGVEPKPSPPPATPPRPDDPVKRAAFAKAVSEMRLAMSRRNLAAARQHLKTVAANVQNPDDKARAERLETMLDHLFQFWNGVCAAVAKLQPTEELVLKDNRVAVIAANRDELIVQVYGRPQRYQTSALPLPLLAAIVQQSFAATPGSKVIVGTFHAIDQQGDRATARQLWEEAAKEGFDLGRQLLPELDAPGANGGK